jgi:hypothetical protein
VALCMDSLLAAVPCSDQLALFELNEELHVTWSAKYSTQWSDVRHNRCEESLVSPTDMFPSSTIVESTPPFQVFLCRTSTEDNLK